MKILFVCTGNICRSPMADRLLRHLLLEKGVRDIQVASCGTWGLTGERATPEARTVMRSRGVDLSPHRARELVATEVRNADLVIAMTSVHLREIENASPNQAHKTFLLKEILELTPVPPPPPGSTPTQRLRALLAAERPPWRRELDLDDPMGLPLATYERCAAHIEEGVRRLVGLLVDQHAV